MSPDTLILGAAGYTGAVTPDNGWVLYAKNAHGDVMATLTDGSSGQILDLYKYDEFGNVDYLKQSTDNRILYASQYLDTETGNYYLKVRYYNPLIGRFTQRDPHWTPENMIYGDVTESAPEPDIRSSDYAVYVPKPIQRKAMVLPTGSQRKYDNVRGIIAETMAFSDGATYNGNVYADMFAGFGVPSEDTLFASYYARQADTGAILQSTNLYVYCTNNPVMYVDENGEFLGTLLDVASAVDFVKKPSIKKAVVLAVDVAAAVLPGVPSTGAVKVAKAAANVAKKAGDAIAATKAAKTVVNTTKTVAKATKAVAQTVKKTVTVAKGAEKAGDIGKAVGTTVEAVTSTTAKKVVTETIENAGEAAVKADVIADTGKNLETAANAVTSPTTNVVAETAQSVGEAAATKVNNSIDGLETALSKSDVVEVELSRSKYPESAKHIEDAIANGQPEILTIDRGAAKANRRASLKGKEKVQGMDLDEYPPAMSREGGAGSSVRPILPSDNRGSGSVMGNRLRAYADGTKYRFKIVD